MDSRTGRPGRHALSAPLGFALALAIALSSACNSAPRNDPTSYVKDVAEGRAIKDKEFSSASDSPIPPARRAEFLPLTYFPIDPEYKVATALNPSTDTTIVPMATSIGGRAQFRRVGTFEFTLKGQPFKLTAFHEVGARGDTLFVPFTDLTTGNETYDAGRFLELQPNGSGIYEIDFNRAFFPYCYYNITYECPISPRENHLQVPVRAGERLKKEDAKAIG
ncbi:MAG: DUF1684 domain-containing protein [Acidobacteriota bacterium]